MSKEKSSSTTSCLFGTLLAVLFIGLKLGNVITWAWVWVLAPIWGPIALVIAAFAIYLTISCIAQKRANNKMVDKFVKDSIRDAETIERLRKISNLN
jgi:hypothetical protein